MSSTEPAHDTPLAPPARERRRATAWRHITIALGGALLIAAVWGLLERRIDREREQALEVAMQANARQAQAYEQQIRRTLRAAEQVAAFVRAQYLRDGTRLPLADWVRQGVIREPMFKIVSVVDARGDLVLSSQTTGQVSYADREFFRLQREAREDRLYVSPPVLGRVSGRWQVPMSLRITRPDGRFDGVVVLSVDPGQLAELDSGTELGRQGLLELTGLDGVVRVRRAGQELRFGMDARRLPWFQRRLSASQDQWLDDGEAVDGEARLVNYRSLADYPLMVVVGTSVEDALAPVQPRHTRYRVWASGLSALLLWLTVLLLRRR